MVLYASTVYLLLAVLKYCRYRICTCGFPNTPTDLHVKNICIVSIYFHASLIVPKMPNLLLLRLQKYQKESVTFTLGIELTKNMEKKLYTIDSLTYSLHDVHACASKSMFLKMYTRLWALEAFKRAPKVSEKFICNNCSYDMQQNAMMIDVFLCLNKDSG